MAHKVALVLVVSSSIKCAIAASTLENCLDGKSGTSRTRRLPSSSTNAATFASCHKHTAVVIPCSRKISGSGISNRVDCNLDAILSSVNAADMVKLFSICETGFKKAIFLALMWGSFLSSCFTFTGEFFGRMNQWTAFVLDSIGLGATTLLRASFFIPRFNVVNRKGVLNLPV